jgi:hypothetical protein
LHRNVGQNIVDPRNIIRAGIAASVAIHLSFLALAMLFSEVRPFGPVAAENVAVDVVTPDEVPDKAPEPMPQPQTSDGLDLSSKPAPESSPPKSSLPNSSSANSSPPKPSQSSASQPTTSQPSAASPPASLPAASQPQPSTQPQQQATLASPKPPPNPDWQQPATPPQASAPPSAYALPQPDISVKYHVLLGLPQDRPGDAFDAPATENADIEANSIAEFRRHLRSCSTLPKSIAPTDDVSIKLRVMLTRDGRLAADPVLIEAKASMKGPLLMQAAIGALQSCQPYAMLPTEKYNEWKVLDLNFTPHDFGAS